MNFPLLLQDPSGAFQHAYRRLDYRYGPYEIKTISQPPSLLVTSNNLEGNLVPETRVETVLVVVESHSSPPIRPGQENTINNNYYSSPNK